METMCCSKVSKPQKFCQQSLGVNEMSVTLAGKYLKRVWLQTAVQLVTLCSEKTLDTFTSSTLKQCSNSCLNFELKMASK